MTTPRANLDQLTLKRLQAALRYLELARPSVYFGAVPYVMSAELLIQQAIITQQE